jgi:hypothetical protein
MLANPFAELAASIPPVVMQTYVALMALLVVAGTLADIHHKRSAVYFFANWRESKARAKQRIGAGRGLAIALKTAVIDVAASGEFCNARRRIAHLLGMYGFVLYVAAAAILIFAYPTPATPAPALLSALWYVGALMICIGSYWFWFFIRVDVSAEGKSPFRLVRADLFIVSLVLSATLGLIWAAIQTAGAGAISYVFLALYVIATTVLFAGIPWSKFSHMFFKPAASFERRLSDTNGTRSNLPAPADAPAKFDKIPTHAHHY